MELQELALQIKTNKLKSLYIFTGEEVGIRTEYINIILKQSKAKKVVCETLAEAIVKMQKGNFISDKNIYIIYDDKEYKQKESWWNKNIIPQSENVILIYSDIDKRTKFYKAHQEIMVDFQKLSEQILIKYIQKEIDLSNTLCSKLISLCDFSYSRIMLEVDKIKCLDLKADKAFQELVDNNLIFDESKEDIFNFIKQVLLRKLKKSYILYSRMTENPLGILSLLYKGFRNVLMVQSCNTSNIAEVTGLTGWEIKNAKEVLNNYTLGEIVNILNEIRELEQGIKTGKYPAEVVINILIGRCY